jgi:hydrogen peroxide-dependent heme synthase
VIPLSERPGLPAVPLTLDGSSVLHQFFRFDWRAWRALPHGDRAEIAAEAVEALGKLERESSGAPVRTSIYSQLGHKGDLILLHFRESFAALSQVELDLAQTRLYDFLDLRHSYLSVVELGLYESSRKTYEAASAKGYAQHSPEWNADVAESLKRSAGAMAPRLFPAIPDAKHFCFYPMNRKRDEKDNWYTVPFADRQRMMHEHGMVGRRYAGQVQQIVTGSIGFDDWEWGVTLFAEDHIAFKKLIYEMRFDEVSAVYALFGPFYVGIRLPIDKLPNWLNGKL